MKYFYNHVISSLLFILIINTHIISANENFKRHKINSSLKTKSKKDICEKDVSEFIDYGIFLKTAYKRAKSSFSDQINDAIKGNFGLDKFEDEKCIEALGQDLQNNINEISSEKIDISKRLQDNLNIFLKDINKLQLTELQKEQIHDAVLTKSPRDVCNAFRDSILTNLHESDDNKKKLSDKIKILRTLISNAEEKNYNKQKDYISKDEVHEILDSCTLFKLISRKCDIQKELWTLMQNLPDKNNNFYSSLKSTYTKLEKERKSLLMNSNVGKEYSDIECYILPNKEGEIDLCNKTYATIIVKAFWVTIKNYKTIADCGINKFLDLIISNYFSHVEDFTKLLIDMLGFGLLFRSIKFLWNLGVIMYNLYMAINIGGEIESKSQYWGEVAGATTRLIIDLVVRRKFHRYK